MAVPILCIAGKKGCGKTRLLERLLPELVRRGLRVGTLKNDYHGFEMDTPGKDTWRHRRSGAAGSLIVGPDGLGLVRNFPADAPGGARPDPAALAEHYFGDMDLVLAEGFSRANAPKIEVFRPQAHAAPLLTPEQGLTALVTDVREDELPEAQCAALRDVPRFNLADVDGLADFVLQLAGIWPLPS